MKRLLSFCVTVLLLLTLGGCASGGHSSASSEAQPAVIPTVYGIKGPTAVGLVNMMKDQAQAYTFRLVGSPDEITGKLSTGEVDIAAIPTNLAATLYAKTNGGVKMLACNTLGVLSVLENGDTVKQITDLKGRTILTSGQGANPEYILKYVLEKNGIDPEKDVTIQFIDDNDALTAQLLVSSAGTVAMVPQPAATAVLTKAAAQKVPLKKVLDMNEEWNKVARADSLVMGCMVVRTAFAEEHPKSVEQFLNDYKASVEKATSDLDGTADLCAANEVLPNAAIAKQAIPQCNLVYIAGKDMQPKIEPYFQILFEANANSVGGAVPDAGFYYTK